jgi:mRNA-degrading endonuclease toxin of MazEF toxin-antitoxin module
LVVLVPFPFSDLSATKRRSALVVSPEEINVADVVLCAMNVMTRTPRLFAAMARSPRTLRVLAMTKRS